MSITLPRLGNRPRTRGGNEADTNKGDTVNRLERYKAILDEFGIDPKDDSYSGGEDAQAHVSGETPLEQFCIVSRGGEFVYAKAIWPTLENAKAGAVENIDDEIFAETPLAIIDLDSGERIAPDFESLQWKATQ